MIVSAQTGAAAAAFAATDVIPKPAAKTARRIDRRIGMTDAPNPPPGDDPVVSMQEREAVFR